MIRNSPPGVHGEVEARRSGDMRRKQVMLTCGTQEPHIPTMPQSYYVRAVWDEDAGVYFSETNVPGLNIEAETLHGFIEIAEELAPQMLEANVPEWRADQPKARPTVELALAIA